MPSHPTTAPLSTQIHTKQAHTQAHRRSSRTSASSLPASLRYAFVHLTLRGLRFILKFLWHLDRQKRKICGREGSEGTPRRLQRRGAAAAAAAGGSKGGDYGWPGGGLTVASFLTNVMPWPG